MSFDKKIKEIVKPKITELSGKVQLINHIQKFSENFNNAEKKAWKGEFEVLTRSLGI